MSRWCALDLIPGPLDGEHIVAMVAPRLLVFSNWKSRFFGGNAVQIFLSLLLLPFCWFSPL